MRNAMVRAIVLVSSTAAVALLALEVISFIRPGVIGYGHISTPAAGRCDWFYACVYVNADRSGWIFQRATDFDSSLVRGGGLHWNRTSLRPLLFDAEGWRRVDPDGSARLHASVAFPLWIALVAFTLPAGVWFYRRRKLRNPARGFPVAIERNE
jgi:hypothetical protein